MKTVVLWFVLQLAYMAPTIVACHRNHPKSTALTALNYLGGWTVIGWIGGMVWALADKGPPITASEGLIKSVKHVGACIAITFVVSFLIGLVWNL